MSQRASRYAVNPAAVTKPMWCPQVFQYIQGHKNKSYLNSLWLGAVWNFIDIPHRIALEILYPMLFCRFSVFASSVFSFPLSVLVLFLSGVSGRLIAVPISIEEAIDAVILSPKRSSAAVSLGYLDVIIDMTTVVISAET